MEKLCIIRASRNEYATKGIDTVQIHTWKHRIHRKYPTIYLPIRENVNGKATMCMARNGLLSVRRYSKGMSNSAEYVEDSIGLRFIITRNTNLTEATNWITSSLSVQLATANCGTLKVIFIVHFTRC
jgi:hypothetical protein